LYIKLSFTLLIFFKLYSSKPITKTTSLPSPFDEWIETILVASFDSSRLIDDPNSDLWKIAYLS
jgi:hypothetical protein